MGQLWMIAINHKIVGIMSLVSQLVGEEGAKFDITVSLSRQSMVEIFSALIVVALIAVAVNIVASKL